MDRANGKVLTVNQRSLIPNQTGRNIIMFGWRRLSLWKRSEQNFDDYLYHHQPIKRRSLIIWKKIIIKHIL